MTSPQTPARLSPQDVIELTLDPDSFQPWDGPLPPLEIEAGYREELAAAKAKSGHDESIVTGRGTIDGHPVAVVLGEFRFLGGSIGVNAATRITQAIEKATSLGLPLVASPVSGGTRMQEGTAAFVQMARITAAINAHKEAKLPYLVYLRHPTTGGVYASWGSLGHVTLTQPHALIGFLGPKVYKALNGADFPSGVQQSENLHRHCLVDAVMDLPQLRTYVAGFLNVVHAEPNGLDLGTLPGVPAIPLESTDSWEAVTESRNPDRPGLRRFLEIASTNVVPVTGFPFEEDLKAISVSLASIGGRGTVVLGLDGVAARQGAILGPQALREAQRGMALAADLGLPLLTVIDTAGADLSKESEEGGLGQEIAQSLSRLLSLPTPTVTLLLGQGAGGGALALFPADRIIALSNSWLAPLPPEGASAIVHGDTSHAAEMARQQRVGAVTMFEDGLIDDIVSEAQISSHDLLYEAAAVVHRHLTAVATTDVESLVRERRRRYEAVGTLPEVARLQTTH